MRYMGFGMRKEVYQRKSKKAFEKIKKAYEQESKSFHSDKLELKNRKLDENIKKRIRDRIRREERNRLLLVISVTVLIFVGLGILVKINVIDYIEYKEKYSQKNKTAKHLFNRKLYKKDNELYMIADYYNSRGIASAFRIINGVKHQNSESYYLTGEQFRSALYNYDTLVYEYYFYKNGDTIQNYPITDHNSIARIRLKHPKKEATIQFKVLDYKIVPGSYEVINVQTYLIDE